MGKNSFTLSDIPDELLHYMDKYLKAVIMNAVRRYYRTNSRARKHGIVFVELDQQAEDLCYKEPGFEQAMCQWIETQGFCIPISNMELAEALRGLTDRQRLVLLQNVVLNLTMDQIAQRLGITTRMAKKHKHNAIQAIKRRMSYHGEG